MENDSDVSIVSLRIILFQNVLKRQFVYLRIMAKAPPKVACLNPGCGKTFSGNENKKFCSIACKNEYHNAKRKTETKDIGTIVTILKTNRRILEELLDGRSVKSVSEQRLLDSGFIFRYHTHIRVNKGDGKEYKFCFDFGYQTKSNGWYQIVKGFKESDD